MIFALIGESFRYGKNGSRARGNIKDTINKQITASWGHVYFKRYIEKKYNTKIEFMLFVYSHEYNHLLNDIYNPVYVHKQDSLVGQNKMLQTVLRHVNENIFIFRIDMFLKRNLFEVFNPFWNEIRYPCILSEKAMKVKARYFPAVNDVCIFVPKHLKKDTINVLKSIYPEAGHSFMKRYMDDKYPMENINLMINTLHDSDSYKDWNPLYYFIGRPQYSHWKDHGKTYDIKKNKVINGNYFK